MRVLKLREPAVLAITVACLSITACGGGHDKSANVPTNSSISPAAPSTTNASASVPTEATGNTTSGGHHSAMAGAAVGAVAGHMLGKHAVAGAAVGALVQHERNKHRKSQ